MDYDVYAIRESVTEFLTGLSLLGWDSLLLVCPASGIYEFSIKSNLCGHVPKSVAIEVLIYASKYISSDLQSLVNSQRLKKVSIRQWIGFPPPTPIPRPRASLSSFVFKPLIWQFNLKIIHSLTVSGGVYTSGSIALTAEYLHLHKK